METLREESVKFVPDDIIAGILGFLGSAQETTFLTSNPRLIHETVYGLREKHPLLKGFVFSTSGVYPVSPLLERVLARLQMARILRLEKPDFRRYILDQKAKRVIAESVHHRFNEEQLSELQEIAKEFERQCLASTE